MQQTLLINKRRPKLLLFFAGWGMDERPFRPLTNRCPADTDWMICYGYTDPAFDRSLVEEYKEVNVVAWSFGVRVAQTVMEAYDLPVVHSTAINGTSKPIDEEYGISPEIFEATLQGLTPESLDKFRKRMCGSSVTYQHFMGIAPKRDVQELRTELEAFGKLYSGQPVHPDHSGRRGMWNLAIIGECDRIFLAERQLNYWRTHAGESIIVQMAHYEPDIPFLSDVLISLNPKQSH